MRYLYPLIASFLLASVTGISQQIQTITFGLGNTKNVTVTNSNAQSTGIRTLELTGYLPNKNAAARFLSQATLGPTVPMIQDVEQSGIETWLDQQLAMPNAFRVNSYLSALHQSMVDSLKLKDPANASTYTLQSVFVGDYHFNMSWFQGAMTAADVLRWRVGLALSEIFVTSRVSEFDDNPYALAHYYDMLQNNAFGTYRALLDSVTYHPAMGSYLTFMNNHATDYNPSTGRRIYPDENYAREIMQLFSIGLYRLNNDGTETKDANNRSIPTYDNNDIAGLAKVFTGLSWWDSRYLGDSQKDKWSYTKRMRFFGMDSSDAVRNPWKTNPRIVNGHEVGSKTFLGYTIPGSRTAAQGQLDIRDALDVISNHPNVGPFISRRLIQRLITSNPSKEYIGRVASVFNNNGSGVRGDLKAVVRAIFLDPEARRIISDQENNTTGMLREPFVRYMNILRSLPKTTTGTVYRNVMRDIFFHTGQIPLAAPTVFNFFQPDFQPDGDLKANNKYGPEFQILNAQTLSEYFNGLTHWLIEDDPVEYWGLFNGETYKPDQNPGLDFTADYALARNDRLPILLDKYNTILAHGRLSTASVTAIRNAVSGMPYSENSSGVPNADAANRRIRMALFLIMTSPDYLISR
jgi:uncharacterized protein (DUF1800 family)